MAMHARPVPIDPYNPVPPTSNASGVDIIQHPSPFVPIRLPIFALVIWLNDCIIRVLNVGGRRGTASSNRFRGRHKSLSDTVEGIEEGQETDIRSPWNSSRSGNRHGIPGYGRYKAD